MIHVPSLFLARHSPVAALAERTDRLKQNRRDRLRFSANPESDVANRLAAEAFFQFSQDVDLGDLFEFVVQGRLEHADVEDAFA